MRQYRPRKANGDELEEVFYGADGKEYTKHQTMRRRYVLKPEKAKHITAGQFVKKFRLITIFIFFYLTAYFISLIDKRHKNLEGIRQQLEEGGGVLGDSGIPVVTDLLKYPDELKNLPKMILLSNGEIMNIKKYENIVSLVGDLDHFGLRVMTEPFMDEEEIALEQNMPDKNVLILRLKEIFPFSDFSSDIC